MGDIFRELVNECRKDTSYKTRRDYFLCNLSLLFRRHIKYQHSQTQVKKQKIEINYYICKQQSFVFLFVVELLKIDTLNRNV